MIAAVSNRGLMRFKLYEGAMNGAIFIDFMTRLVRDAKQKVFRIVGDPRVHLASFDKSSGAVQEWLAHHKGEIEIFTRPADAPEHIPDEYLNNDLKQTINNKPPARTCDDPSRPPRRSTERSRNAAAGSNHISMRSMCAMPLEESSVCLKYF